MTGKLDLSIAGARIDMQRDSKDAVDTAVIGAGIIGIAAACYLCRDHRVRKIVVIDPLDPMSLTSAQSGENYRNWWPHPLMTAFTDHSIDLMERIALDTGNRINVTRRGYALATRRGISSDLIGDLCRGYGAEADRSIRVHEPGSSGTYAAPRSSVWSDAPTGVDLLCDPALIRSTFPSFAPDVATVLHIRRAGSLSGQQLGQFMLDAIRDAGGRLVRGRVIGISGVKPFVLQVATGEGSVEVRADRIINAAGPYLRDIATMLGEDFPVSCVYQQKIAFEDRDGAIPRDMPFSIDLDGQSLAWSEEERAVLSEDSATARLLEPMPGGIHCRPDGGSDGKWIKLGWAYNDVPTDPHQEDPIDPQFPDTVLRAASRLHPGLRSYIGRLPRGARHYGGYYTMTKENWPLIGPMRTPGAYVAGALSGFGTMAACATGALCAAWISGGELPPYARALSPTRYDNPDLLAELAALSSRGIL